MSRKAKNVKRNRKPGKKTASSKCNRKPDLLRYDFRSSVEMAPSNLSLPVAGDKNHNSSDELYYESTFENMHGDPNDANDCVFNKKNMKYGLNLLFKNTEKYLTRDDVAISQLHNWYSLLCQFQMDKKFGYIPVEKYNTLIANYPKFILSMTAFNNPPEDKTAVYSQTLVIVHTCIDHNNEYTTYKFSNNSIINIIIFLRTFMIRSYLLSAGEFNENKFKMVGISIPI